MLFMPVDLFKPHVQGQQQAIKDNWNDLFNAEKLRQDYVTTDKAEATQGGDIFATNQRNQFLGNQSGRLDQLGAARQPGQVAVAGLNSAAQQAQADAAYNMGLPQKNAQTWAQTTDTGLNQAQQDAQVKQAGIDWLGGDNRAQTLGVNRAQNVFDQPRIDALRNQGALQTIPAQTAYDVEKARQGTQGLAGSGAAQAAGNTLELGTAQLAQRAQFLQQYAPQMAGLLSFRGDSSTPENALALQQHTDSANQWFRTNGLLESNQQVVFPPGQEPVINTYNADGSILSTAPAVQQFDRMAEFKPAVTVGPGGRVAPVRAPAGKQPVVNPLAGARPSGPLPTGTQYRAGGAQGTTPGAAQPQTATTPNPSAPAEAPLTEDHVKQAKSALDALSAQKLQLFQQYPGLQHAAHGFNRLDMPFEGGGEAEVPNEAVIALAKLDSRINTAKQQHDQLRQRWGVVQRASQEAADNKAAEDLLRNLK
ncbi:hypothetical protein P3T23_004517 [Paraburkholderia sp. GAS448]|uniref:hypothetical protein n=1 Tax=Paraburkholderia sp. GAS448 TaxID=3035136 RepID=UPI003D19A429